MQSPGFMSGENRFSEISNPHAGFPGPGKYDWGYNESRSVTGNKMKNALFYSKAPRGLNINSDNNIPGIFIKCI